MVRQRPVGNRFNALTMTGGAVDLPFSSGQGFWDRILGPVEYALAIGTVFFSPMNFLRLPFFYFTLSDALACLCLLLLVLRGRLKLQPLGPASTAIWMIGLTTMLASLLLSSLVHGDPMRGIVYIAQYFFAYFILLLVIGGRSERQMIVLAKMYVLSIVIMCIHGAYLINIDGQTNTAFVSGSGRLTGFVERENECGAVIAMTVPMLLLLCGSGRLTKFALLALPIMGYAVMLTGSNTGLASFAYALGVFALFTLNWTFLVGAAAVVAGTVLALDRWGRDYLPAVFQRRVLGALESGDIGQAGSFDHRLELIHEAIGRANDTIFLGVGADQYAVTSFLMQPVHNLYLLLWTEGGLLCVVGFFVMISAGFGPGLAALNKPGGRLFAACTVSTVSLFLLSINAFPSVYGRFWSMPIILTVSLSCAFLSRPSPVR
ncbi:O-antigen ligase family protein [Rhizobium sp. KVB221]|uniref:O-antigen ligase family protein n=1 Tax=Rhizobium setariae TaxID=2801340 RepID=A0A937CN07_9HYPH|nr:O-antigen ligase family protein [Rhizobium setariae]MBL0373281.1 O-antigen ligase family protein [Rhizobium setariae]